MKGLVNAIKRCCHMSNPALRVVKRILNVVPLIGVAALVLFSYKEFVLDLVVNLHLRNGYVLRGLFAGIIYHMLGAMCVWSYYAAALKQPPSVDELDQRSPESTEQLLHSNDIEQQQTPSINGLLNQPPERRFCKRCKIFKIDRMHHCSWCEKCVSRFDHHCPWIGNCVGQHNYKCFVLLLFYALSFSGFVTVFFLTSLSLIPKKYLAAVYTLMAIGVAISLSTFCLLVFHLYLLFTNNTTLECGMRFAECHNCSCGPHKYNLGWKRNFTSIFGNNCLTWLLPIKYFA